LALHQQDPGIERAQVERLVEFRKQRNNPDTVAALAALSNSARGADNLVPAILAAIKARATLGEIADVLREVFGEYRPG
jgi:methylmalonyl-CoA mutase N-terminal domain/subunit